MPHTSGKGNKRNKGRTITVTIKQTPKRKRKSKK